MKNIYQFIPNTTKVSFDIPLLLLISIITIVDATHDKEIYLIGSS